MRKISLFIFINVFLIYSNAISMDVIDPRDTILDVENNEIYLLGCSYKEFLSPLNGYSNCNDIYKINYVNNNIEVFCKGNRYARMTLSPNDKYIAVLDDYSFAGENNKLVIFAARFFQHDGKGIIY